MKTLKTEAPDRQRAEVEAKAARLKGCRERAGYRSARQAAIASGWHYSTYAGHENASREYNRRDAEIYAVKYGTTADYLLTGNLNANLPNSRQLSEIFRDIRFIPLLEISDLMTLKHIGAGGELANPPEAVEPLPSHIRAGPRAIALKIADRAMAGGTPSLEPGYIGYFDPDAQLETGCIVAAIVTGYPILTIGKYRVIAGTGGGPHFELIPANSDFPSFSTASHDINPVGRLVSVWFPV